MPATTVEVTQVKCACTDCVCVVATDNAVVKDGRYYCCDACADGPNSREGCNHAGCKCHG
ncbi:MAG: metallothionein [Pseudomonadota bacterium]